jgi:isoamylase
MVKNIASRIIGSHDIYLDPHREPNRSINFITCHDGFTLNDLVSYNHKHNESNGENNQDGTSENFSWNCGAEGPSDNADIEALRLRQIKNFLTLLFISQGTPMLLMGDEVRRTQFGNNNAYCQDDETNWFDWDLLNKNKELLAFVKGLITFTQSRPVFAQEQFLKTEINSREPYILWHGIHLNKPDWEWSSHSLAGTLVDPEAKESLHIMINAYWKEMEFEIPVIKSGNKWRLIVDTAREYPEDFNYIHEASLITHTHYLVHPRSVVMLYKD